MKAFSTAIIDATFPVNLEPGQYWANIKVYKDNDIMKAEDRTFTVYAPGEMGDSAPSFGIWPILLLSLYFTRFWMAWQSMISMRAASRLS